jgi:hypothetical protein
MSHYYAQISNGMVTGVTQTAAPVTDAAMVELDSYDTSKLGHAYANGVFTPPAPVVAPPNRVISRMAFKGRFRPAERNAIRAASLTTPSVEDDWDMLTSAATVNLDNRDVVALVRSLRGANLISPARSAEILTSPVLDDERP